MLRVAWFVVLLRLEMEEGVDHGLNRFLVEVHVQKMLAGVQLFEPGTLSLDDVGQFVTV